MMSDRKFVYHFEELPSMTGKTDEFIQRINELGAKGWELIHTERVKLGEYSYCYPSLFKHELKGP